MVHLPALIRDLALILMAAGLVTLLFRYLRQPVVLGYIIAGLLIGPNVPLFPTVMDRHGVQIWAEIGVIFLLFALGLEFSFKKLVKVGGAASVTALVEVVGMTLLGYFSGRAFGWGTLDSIFLGGILAISSTTIIIRAFEELGVKGRGFASLVFGILVVEDLFAILLLVLLSTVAVKNQLSGAELAFTSLRLVFFVVLFFLSGIFLLPPLFRKVKRHLNDETLLVVSLGLCFLMVVMNTQAGFSPALGAFLMGSILAETSEAHRVEHLIRPVKNLFGAIFFVSVGMLIDPGAIYEHATPILILTLVTIGGKFLTTLAGALLSGRNLRHSMQAGLSLAQIGEFSFIIASLGLSLKVTSDFLYPIAVGVSAITTFTTPYLIRSSDGAYALVRRIFPAKAIGAIEGYTASTQRVSANREWREVLSAYGLLTLVNGVIISAIFLSLSRVLPSLLEARVGGTGFVSWICLALACFCAAPFFWALLLSRPKREMVSALWRTQEYRHAILGLEMARFGFAMVLFGVLASQLIPAPMAAGVTVALALICFFALSRHLDRVYSWLERRVIENLAEGKPDQRTPPLAPWDAHISSFELLPDAEASGRTLEELKVRESFGVTIASVSRGGRVIAAPGRHQRLFPGDRIAVIGTDEQIEKFGRFLAPMESPASHDGAASFGLQQLLITESMPFARSTIRDSGLRERTDGLVVGVERDGRRFLNPDSTFEILPGDLLWIVGDRRKIAAL